MIRYIVKTLKLGKQMSTRDQLVKAVEEAEKAVEEAGKALEKFDQDPNSEFTLRDQLVKEVEKTYKAVFEADKKRNKAHAEAIHQLANLSRKGVDSKHDEAHKAYNEAYNECNEAFNECKKAMTALEQFDKEQGQ